MSLALTTHYFGILSIVKITDKFYNPIVGRVRPDGRNPTAVSSKSGYAKKLLTRPT